MMFFFKEKPVEITAYVRKRNTLFAEATPIVKAKEAFPTWWKSIPSSKLNWETFKAENTVKSCPGIVHSLTTGYILPLWTDVAMEWDKDYWRTQCADGQTIIGAHRLEQTGNFYENYWHIKIESPWIITSPVPLIFSPPFYSYDTPLPFIMPPGINKTIKQHAATHPFVFLEKTDLINKFLFKAGSPLLHIIPLTDKKTNLKIKIVSDEDYAGLTSMTAGNNMFTSRGIKNQFRLNK